VGAQEIIVQYLYFLLSFILVIDFCSLSEGHGLWSEDISVERFADKQNPLGPKLNIDSSQAFQVNQLAKPCPNPGHHHATETHSCCCRPLTALSQQAKIYLPRALQPMVISINSSKIPNAPYIAHPTPPPRQILLYGFANS